MKITAANFMIELKNTVTELVLINERLKDIKQDTLETHHELEMLNGRFIQACEPVENLIIYISKKQPDPAIVGNSLKDTITLMSSILREKTRIIKDTPEIIYLTNNETSLN
jgi:hypothetical protein